MRLFPVRDDFPPQFYDEFARLVVAFGRIEYLIKLCVKDLLADGFTNGMAEAESRRQFSVLCKEAKKRADEKLCRSQASAFSALIDRAEALADFRNDTVHASWTTDLCGQPLRIRPKLEKAKPLDLGGSRVVRLCEIQSKREQIEHVYRALDAERRSWSSSTTRI